MDQLVKGFLTIGVPSYNGAANLANLFASAAMLGLRADEYELLVVDNASTDDTTQLVAELKGIYPNIRYHRHDENIGRIQNWNKVIELSRGEYLIMMNVNDRFVSFDAHKAMSYLTRHPEVSMILTDIQFEDHVYPNWRERGLLNLDQYLQKTFLETEYLEFHSVGVLHQHIFRTSLILKHHIRFDPSIPRTTDRVFVGQVAKAGGGQFYYLNQTLASWHLSAGRYHYQVHVSQKHFNFDELWLNEHQANVQLAELGGISFRQVLRAELIAASFHKQVNNLRRVKDYLLRTTTPTQSLELPTARVFYAYLKTLAQLNQISFNYFSLNTIAFKRAMRWYLRSLRWLPPNVRSLKGVIQPVEMK
jgi:glycosyltransferase involved in cell wall biosynthesis